MRRPRKSENRKGKGTAKNSGVVLLLLVICVLFCVSGAFSSSEVEAAAKKLVAETGSETLVIKAQIHAGGRGKGRLKEHPDVGGVQVVKGVEAAKEAAEKLLGSTLVTLQTGPAGQKVGRVLVEQGLDIARELYLGLVVDREKRSVCVMASSEGGVEIEEVAARTPEKILKEWVDPGVGLLPFQARRLVVPDLKP